MPSFQSLRIVLYIIEIFNGKTNKKDAREENKFRGIFFYKKKSITFHH